MVPVGDAGDPRLADYVRLTDVHLRRSLEAPTTTFDKTSSRSSNRGIWKVRPIPLLARADARSPFTTSPSNRIRPPVGW